MKIKFISFFIALFLTNLTFGENTGKKIFKQVNKAPWKEVFSDDMTKFDDNVWLVDGVCGFHTNSSKGLFFSAGPQERVDKNHTVLWLKQYLKGDLKIEYDYTRMDSSKVGSVNIIYIHAQGSGIEPYQKDIMKWNSLREIPFMRTYFNNMSLYHISYAVVNYDKNGNNVDYVRARQYNPWANKGLTDTALKPEYENTSLFKTGVKYHITVILKDNYLVMRVKNKQDDAYFYFNVNPEKRLTEGYLGFRQMWGRQTQYANLKISTLK